MEGNPTRLSDTEQVDWLRLVRTPSIGARTFIELIERYGSPAAAIAELSEIAADLGNAGYVIMSGLARGVDGAAHLGALATGTIAGVAGGIDVVCPPKHAELQARIGETGAVVSDQAIGTQPTARHSPACNRIISGLSAGVLVVEAALKSGSLIPARLALEQGREVFAVPGSPRDPRCGGTSDLIRQGAALTETAEDILEGLERQMLRPPPAPRRPISFEPVELKAEIDTVSGYDEIVKFLGASPTGVDEPVRECHMSAASVKSILLKLELPGRIERHSGNRVSLIL